MIFCMLYLFNTNVFAHRCVLPVLRPRHFLQGVGAADPLLPVRTSVVIL